MQPDAVQRAAEPTDGVFSCLRITPVGIAVGAAATFIPDRPITPADLEALQRSVRRRLILWHRRVGLDDEAVDDMLAWARSGFSIDASVQISLDDHDAPSV